MAQVYTYSTHALPCPRTSSSQPPNFSSLADRYAALRLEALLSSPKAFASTYAIESTFTPERWGAKIWRDDAVVLVCVAHPVSPSGEGPKTQNLDGIWVGSAILRGPLPISEYALAPESGAPSAGGDANETKWQMTAVFTSTAHRGRGLGKMLIRAGKDYALEQTRLAGSSSTRVRVMIHPDNLVVLGLYSATGFVDVARGTGQEAYRTNGDLADWDFKLRSLTEPEKVLWQTARVAVVMEWVWDGVI